MFTGAYALNPLTDERIPIWVADYVLMGYGTGAIMAVPAHDERDFAFARQFGLPIEVVIQQEESDEFDPDTMTEAYHGPGTLVNSGPLNGKRVPEELPDIIAWLETHGRGRAEVNYRLRDWLISRQRYWGTPIPMVYCDDCGMVPVPESDLPVLLPTDAEFTPTGQSPLVTHAAFLNVPCPRCGGLLAAKPTRWTRSSIRRGIGSGTQVRMTRICHSNRKRRSGGAQSTSIAVESSTRFFIALRSLLY